MALLGRYYHFHKKIGKSEQLSSLQEQLCLLPLYSHAEHPGSQSRHTQLAELLKLLCKLHIALESSFRAGDWPVFSRFMSVCAHISVQ